MAEILYPELSYAIVGAAMEVHRTLGPGFLEEVYERALLYELAERKLGIRSQVRLPVTYKGRKIGDYVADVIVEEKIVLELKAAVGLSKSFEAQALNYLAASGIRLAIILNFGTPSLQQKRVIR